MPRIHPIDTAKATGETATLLDNVRKVFGRIPNLCATAANSPAALAAMMDLFATTARTSLGAATGERIAIAIAQRNECGYCLSAHTAIGRLQGLSPADVAAAQRGTSTDPKTQAILELAIDINAARGHITDSALAAARLAGVSDAEVVEVVAHVALNVFTNYLNSVSETAIDFPVIPLASVV
jgi:uncharacterized peroxidase-related enzyme